jgi:hypothetical protein
VAGELGDGRAVLVGHVADVDQTPPTTGNDQAQSWLQDSSQLGGPRGEGDQLVPPTATVPDTEITARPYLLTTLTHRRVRVVNVGVGGGDRGRRQCASEPG